MKKAHIILLSLIFALSLCSCGNTTTSSNASTSSTVSNSSDSSEHIHSYTDWEETTPATCTEAGERTRTCTECDETETEEIAALGHSFGDWEVTTEATCTDAGVESRTCSVCGESETQELVALGHSFGDWEVAAAATCTDAGEESRTCSVCGEVETQPIEATGHDFKPATVFSPKTCSICGATEGEALSTYISEGSTMSTEDHSFYISDVYYTTKLSEKNGNTTYSYGSDGNYLVLKLAFTNLSTETLEKSGGSRVSNLKLTYGNKYDYDGNFWILVSDIVPLATGNAYIMFAVPDTMEQDTEKSIYTTFTIDGTDYSYVVSWGNGDDWETASDNSTDTTTDNSEGNATGDENDTAPAAAATDTPYSLSYIGSTGEGENFQFTLDDAYYTTKLSESHGNSTTSYSFDDQNMLVLQLDFTNLGTEALEKINSSRISDMMLTYNEKYNYDGEARVLVDGIVPLDTANLYIYYIVPDTVKNAAEPLIAVFTIDGVEYSVDCRALGL